MYLVYARLCLLEDDAKLVYVVVRVLTENPVALAICQKLLSNAKLVDVLTVSVQMVAHVMKLMANRIAGVYGIKGFSVSLNYFIFTFFFFFL